MLYAFFWVIPRRQRPGNCPEESIQHSEHGVSLKTRILHFYGEETARYIRLFGKLRIIGQGITQKKAYNIENTKKV
jgi:hypothetical protein